MSASIDSNAGWAAYENISAELSSPVTGDRFAVLVSSISLIGLVLLVILAYMGDAV